MIGSGILLILYLIRLYFTDLTHFNKQLSQGRPSSLSLIKDFGSIVNDKRFLIFNAHEFCYKLYRYRCHILSICFCRPERVVSPAICSFFLQDMQ